MKYSDLTSLETKLTVWLDLSTYCNASCPQCHRTNPNGLDKVDWLPLIKWSLQDFQKRFPIGTLNCITHFEICGTWGDPAMSKDLVKICKYIIENSSAKIYINTNGGVRTTKWWHDLGSYCGKRLTVYFDVDGINNEMHQKYRRGVDLQTVLDNMESLSSTDAVAKGFIILFKHNQDHWEDIKRMCEMYGAEHFYIIKSDRFLSNNIFKFVNENGEDELLEEIDKDLDSVLKNTWINTASNNMMKMTGKTDKSQYIPMRDVTIDR